MPRKPTIQSIIALLMAGILGVFLLSIGGKFLLRNGLHIALPSDAPSTDVHTVDIDWAARYPFMHQDIHTESVDNVDNPGRLRTLLSAYRGRIGALEDSLNAYATDDILLHDEMTAAASAFNRLLGWQISGVGEYNALVTLSDGYLASVFPARDMEKIASDINNFAKTQDASGAPLLCVQGPFKITEQDAGVSGVVDFTNQNADALVSALTAAGTNVLDLRKAMDAEGIRTHAAFFRTDHHWLPETGLWAARVIAERLNDDFGFAIDCDLYDADNYVYEVYPACFLGSQGTKATLAVCAPDDFTRILSQNGMQYQVSVPSLGIEDKRGDFSLFCAQDLIEGKNGYSESSYTAYFFSDVARKRVHNETVGGGKRLLVLSDSFGNVLNPFLCEGIEYVDVIDLRYFNGSLRAYLGENPYDAVLLFFSGDTLGYEEAAADSHTVWHDFR